jgi:hypothetical protein
MDVGAMMAQPIFAEFVRPMSIENWTTQTTAGKTIKVPAAPTVIPGGMLMQPAPVNISEITPEGEREKTEWLGYTKDTSVQIKKSQMLTDGTNRFDVVAAKDFEEYWECLLREK